MCLSFCFFACFSNQIPFKRGKLYVQVKDYPCRLKKYITVKSVVLKKQCPFNLLFSFDDVCGSISHDRI